jgi:arsenate reductase
MALPTDDSLYLISNPGCSKSRGATALLEERGATFTTRAYLDAPLDRAELEDLGRRLGLPVGDWVRRGEGVPVPDGDDAVLDAIAANPVLLQRPILVRGDRAVIGRPPEAILALLD